MPLKPALVLALAILAIASRAAAQDQAPEPAIRAVVEAQVTAGLMLLMAATLAGCEASPTLPSAIAAPPTVILSEADRLTRAELQWAASGGRA